MSWLISIVSQLAWYYQVAVVFGAILWIIFGLNIFRGHMNAAYGSKKKDFGRFISSIIYGVFCGALSSAAIVGAAIGLGFLIHWINVTDGGEKPYVKPITTIQDTVVIIDTIKTQEETTDTDWMNKW